MRQAVVIIHGIGEQKPMDTIRSFIDAVIEDDPKLKDKKYWNEPDNLSELFDLRKYTTNRNHDIKTDFYEYYWAHLMEGTKIRHIFSWLKMLLFTPPWIVPNRLLPIWSIVWLFLIAGFYFLFQAVHPIGHMHFDVPMNNIITSATIFLLLTFFILQIFSYLSFAGRYLSAAPSNVDIRQKIRKKGVQFLRKLHESKKYSRIILVGHSLGSVIAYDLLKFLWTDYYLECYDHTNVPQIQLKSLQQLIQNGINETNIEAYQKTQSLLWQEQRKLGNPWLISDLITLGSPLAHAAYLLANSAEDLKDRQAERELPTCPPLLEDGRFLFTSYTGENAIPYPKRLHHAALFGPTKWTNLYFKGDLIGGALAPIFGNGILDIPVIAKNNIGTYLPTSHLKYWQILKKEHPRNHHPFSTYVLRKVLDLETIEWLGEIEKRMKS